MNHKDNNPTKEQTATNGSLTRRNKYSPGGLQSVPYKMCTNSEKMNVTLIPNHI